MAIIKAIDTQADNLKETFGVRMHARPLFAAAFFAVVAAAFLMPSAAAVAATMALSVAPLWLPVLILGGAWKVWVIWRRSEFIAKQKYVLLEIKPPRNLVKTPLAMEAFLAGLHITGGESTWHTKYWKGGVRTWFSLEIASFEGRVHFYVWTRANFRRIIEAQLYAQYPGAQVVEVPDYTRLMSAKPEEWGVWGCNFKHTEPDPLPIKTYVEYGLDNVQKEPEQVDPLANLIEFMGSMRKGEYLWLQFIIRAHKGEKYNKLNDKGKPYTWKDEGNKLVADIRKATRDSTTDPVTGKEVPGFPNPTKGQSEKIAAIERNIGKLAFDVGARGIYLVEHSKFDATVITGLTGIFKQFSSEGWNGFKPMGGMTQYNDYPWEYGANKQKDITRRELVDAYRRRQFFHEPYAEEAMVMSTEEIATIYHIPSRAIETPSLGRIESATSDAPANLPV